jgi:L-ribulokinase
MKSYALGIDYGTNSCRSLLIDLENGAEVGSTVFNYPSGEMGILLDPKDPHVARQNPQDYLDGLEAVTRGALQQAAAKVPGFDPAQVIGIGIDTTGSTPIPVDRSGTPLGLLPEFKDHLNAMVWLWKDHTGYAEAAEITQVLEQNPPPPPRGPASLRRRLQLRRALRLDPRRAHRQYRPAHPQAQRLRRRAQSHVQP